MRKPFATLFLSVALTLPTLESTARDWSLQDCVNYALQNNISLQKQRLQKRNSHEDLLQAKSALLPNLSFSTSQNFNYTPWIATGISSDGYSRSSIDKFYYNGSYSVAGSWTVWNGNRNHNTVKLNKLIEEKAVLDSATTANNIQEQITQLYIQILYSTEAINVNKESLESSTQNELRGQEMVRIGKMSKADLAQLTAQRAQDEYNVVAAESAVKNYKRQLKQLLQITDDEEFNVTLPETSDQLALREIPALNSVYTTALDHRPELQAYQNIINQSEIQIKIAKAQKLPTVGVNAGVSTNTTSMNNQNWTRQLKTNFSAGAGISVSIPLFDNRSSKTAVNKAMLMRESTLLDLKNEQTGLYSTIENYWLQAVTNQNQFKAAKVSAESAQTSYELLNEQFRLGLKNIVELRTGKDNLLKARQNELQSKYMTILNLDMLQFYQNGDLRK
ncbi:TolC family protein [Prevotella sp.]|uniref:TolC family protein n=1 Tax=Prevotella sp. TaxID=59823 RepID=UPI002F93EEC1